MEHALASLAIHTHSQAERAIRDASKALIAPVDAKVREIADFRDQVHVQTKKLSELTDACETHVRRLNRATASGSEGSTLQEQMEVLHRRILTIEETIRIRESRSNR